MLDPRSTILVTVLMALVFFLILLGLYRSIPTPLPGLREGMLAALFSFIGIGAILVRGMLPDLLSLLGSNAAISIGIVELSAALRLFTGRTVRIWQSLVVVTGISVLGVGTFALQGSYRNLLMFVTAYNAVLLFLCARASWTPDPTNFAARFTTLSLAVTICVSLARFLISALGVEAVSNAFDPTWFQKFYLSMIGVTNISNLLGITLMTYDCLRRMLLDTNQSLESQVAERTRALRLEIATKERLERSIATTAEAERRRIGHELHDDLGQRLTGIRLIAESLARRLRPVDTALKGHALAIERAAREAISQTRALAHGLTPVGPEPEGFHEALAELARSTSAGGVVCKFEHGEAIRIKSQDTATNLFRIAQEAISNAVRHARATFLIVRLERCDGKITLTIADDGVGFRGPEAWDESSGRGLDIMAFRATLIQYRLHIESAPGSGCIVRASEL